jgi:hypothetical protein
MVERILTPKAALDADRGQPALPLGETVRSLVDDRVLAGERGAFRLVKIPDTVHVPATVQAILAARICERVAGRRVA